MGTPAVAVITSAFVDAAELMARSAGFAGYRFAVIDHPISSATHADLATQAATALGQARQLLGMA